MSFQLTRHTRAQLMLDEIDAMNSTLSKADRARKYAKMAASPYAFFRGTNHLFWRDVWNDWRYHLFGGVAETQTWLQGDAHVSNYGAFGHHADSLHYGMDDFDDAVIADYQYDLWRHAASMVLDTRENVGLSSDHTRRAIRHLLSAYLDELRAHQNGEDVSRIRIDKTRKPIGPFMKKVARKNGRGKQLKKWTIINTDGQRVLNTDNGKLAKVSTRTRSQISKALRNDYPATRTEEGVAHTTGRFEIKDIARRVDAGIGSLGLLRYYVLIEGASGENHYDIILDVKEQTVPEAWHLMNAKERRDWRKAFPTEGERHAAAFRAMANYRGYVGWLKLDGKDFSVRERSPFKKDFPTHKIGKLKHYRHLVKQWGRFMAREHIRGARALQPENPGFFCQAVLARCEPRRETFKKEICAVAFSYAQCATEDHRVFVAERIPK